MKSAAREDRVASDATNLELFEIGDDVERSQTAERLGVPEGTAKSRLRLGLGKLAALLEDLT